jgi:rod shape-determining protein MreD
MNIKLPAILIILSVSVIQASIGQSDAIFGIKPNLTLITVYAFAVMGGEGRGILYGAVGGLVDDCLSGGLLGVFLSGYAVTGFLAGRIGKRVFNIGEAANFTGIFILSLIQGLYTAVMFNTFVEGYDFMGGIWRFALPAAAYNAVAGTVFLWLFKKRIASRVPWLKTIRHIKVRLQP